MLKLLRFLVDHRLEDTSRPLKAYTIAVDALGRNEGFDTQTDSYPRVQIGRLRHLLDHFYLREGGACRLSIPYGKYEIILESNGAAAAQSDVTGTGNAAVAGELTPLPIDARSVQNSARRKLPLLPLLAAMVLTASLAIAATLYLTRESNFDGVGYPALIVEDLQGVVSASSQTKITSMQTYLTGALEKFEQIRVYEAATIRDADQAYLLEASILDMEARHIQFRLVDSTTKEVIWSERIITTADEELEPELGRLAIALAGPYGVVAQKEMSRFRGDYTPGYPCVLQFHQYMRFREDARLMPSVECMIESAKRYPHDAYIMSMLAVAKGVSGASNIGQKIGQSATNISEQAVKLDSHSASAAFAVAQTAFLAGNCQKGVMWGKRATELNPLNSRISGYLGMYMFGCKMPEGKDYAERALEMDPNADIAIAATLAFHQLQQGDAKSARALSVRYMALAPKYEPALELAYALSSAMLGDRREARKSWRRLTRRYGLPPNAAPRDVMRKWVANPYLIRETELIFDRVQWP